MKILAALTSLFAQMEPVLSSDGVSARFARMLTDRNNPDHIILAHVLQSFATEFDSWKIESRLTNTYYAKPTAVGPALPVVDAKNRDPYYDEVRYYDLTRTGDKPLSVSVAINVYRWNSSTVSGITSKDLKVGSAPLNPELSLPFITAVFEIVQKHETAKAVAAMAKAEMEANEKKWEIVESVLGMKREDGLLVSAIKCLACGATDDCDSYCDGVVARA